MLLLSEKARGVSGGGCCSKHHELRSNVYNSIFSSSTYGMLGQWVGGVEGGGGVEYYPFGHRKVQNFHVKVIEV